MALYQRNTAITDYMLPVWMAGLRFYEAQAFEVVLPGNKIYNDLVCQAVKDFEQENYRASIRRLEEAGRLILFEFPNFKILPLLALSYHRAGEKKKALKTLEQARVSLLIANGEITGCREITMSNFL